MKFLISIFLLCIVLVNCLYKNDPSAFRLKKMKLLQDMHQWYQAPAEKMSSEFNEKLYSKGKGSVDGFISYLGFLRDSSFKANKSILNKLSSKFLQ